MVTNREEQLTVRFSASELARGIKQADLVGLKPTPFIRMAVLEAVALREEAQKKKKGPAY